MKRIVTLMIFSLCAGMIFAQPALKVDQDGNVGIGTADPEEVLDVKGSVLIPNNNYYKSLRSDGTQQQAFGMDNNNDIVFNRSAITAQKESGLIFGTALRFIDFRNENNDVLMRTRSTGAVSIGTNSGSHFFTVNGDAAKPGGGDWAATSDKRAKKSVRKFTDGLEEVMQINPVFFQYNGKFGTKEDSREFVGIIAQDMQKIAPYTVETREHKLIETDYSSEKGTIEKVVSKENYLAYDGTAVRYMLVNAVKEQQAIIESQDQRIQELEQSIDILLSKIDQISSPIQNLLDDTKAKLDQNAPNPFNKVTKIGYSIPENASTSEILIFDNSGRMVKKVQLNSTGQGSLDLDAATLAAGVYTYKLIVDGESVDTQKMVVAK